MTPRLNEYIPHKPTVKQAAFMLLQHREAFFGGQTGGGKSDALLMMALQHVDVPGYAALLVRKTYAQLAKAGALIPRSHEWLANTKASWNGTEKTWRFPSGARLEFGYLQHEKDRYNYQSSEYQFIGFDEVTDLAEEDYRFLFSRNRKTHDIPVPLRVRSGSNPVGPGMPWVMRRFVEPGDPSRPYIPSALADNPYLDQEGYLEALALLPPLLREALAKGIWRLGVTGEIFSRSHFVQNIRPHVEGEIVRAARGWDLAGTEPSPTNPDPDWTSGVKMVKTSDGKFWITDVARDRVGPEKVEALVGSRAAQDGRKTKVAIQKDPGQAGKGQISYYTRLVLPGYDVVGTPTTGEKVIRWAPFAAQVRAGNVYLVEGSWVDAFLDELEAAPNGDHDDQIDAAETAFTALVEGRDRLTVAPPKQVVR